MKLVLTFLILCTVIDLIYGKCAFVTLIAGPEPEFIDGAIVLGKSLLKVKSVDIDMILLHTPDLNMFQYEELTTNGGWVLKDLEISIPQPVGHVHKSRFEDVYDKLAIFSLTEYTTIVYLDADTLVLESIDELCSVNAEVALVSRGPSANAGVMVVLPSHAKFAEMVDAVATRKANYPNNDQGILNVVHNNFLDCPYVDPLEEETFYTDTLKCARLPARYNADTLIYAVNGNRWPYSPKTATYPQPKVIHYTFGDIKPWSWYSYLLTPNVLKWWEMKSEALEGQLVLTESELAMAYLFILVVVVFIFPEYYYAKWLYDYFYVPLSVYPNVLIVFFLSLNVLALFGAFFISSLFVFSPIANTVLFVIIYNNAMRIILFDHLQFRAVLFMVFLFAFEYGVLSVMFHMGDHLTFFSRIAIFVVLLIIYHWFFCWTVFIRYVLEPLCKTNRKIKKEEAKII